MMGKFAFVITGNNKEGVKAGEDLGYGKRFMPGLHKPGEAGLNGPDPQEKKTSKKEEYSDPGF